MTQLLKAPKNHTGTKMYSNPPSADLLDYENYLVSFQLNDRDGF